MKVVLDCHYSANTARVAAVYFDAWQDKIPITSRVMAHNVASEYIPGQFYKRELPLLELILASDDTRYDAIVLDAYVDLGINHPGLGRHLANKLTYKVPIVGVAKTFYAGCSHAIPIYRGSSIRPLYVTAANMPIADAAAAVKSMHGANRLPTLLKMVDRIARGSDV
ncbi:hypothetical protein TI04_02510 [Achromatium sp. WMS2]|nr:hypothetical protein TI04_02510 [Achromatium sp. WMS2]